MRPNNPFLTPTFLKSEWDAQYTAFRDSPEEAALVDRLRHWAARTDLGETSAEAAFIDVFFRDTWGYILSGQGPATSGFTMQPQFTISGTGQSGGAGKADLALGLFGVGAQPIPQALCEFKSIKSSLDAEQNRKGNRRSPVRQCLDYLAGSRRGMVGSEPILPRWGVVSNMNEFRLYEYDRGYAQYLHFIITGPDTPQSDLFRETRLLDDSEEARFQRFLFARLFHRDTLLTAIGKPELLSLIERRRFRDRRIETEFYERYKAFRDHLITALLTRNGPGTTRFPGTNGRLVRMAQKILDRLLFVFYCEDMGGALAFPPKLLQEFLIEQSSSKLFDASGDTIWRRLCDLFTAMDQGTTFGGRTIHGFNGGLFASDPALDSLDVPNLLFCQPQQAQNEAAIAGAPLTVLFLCATYNYAADAGDATDKGALGLYTLGRIFEQSITELEMIEAKVDGLVSVNQISGRKTDGVYYTPEWIVERLVDGAIGPRFAELKTEANWPDEGEPDPAAVVRYRHALRDFTVLDPACGSGAFLITALKYLQAEWRAVATLEPDPDPMPDFLTTAIHGIDINPSSVEIARLALWLHTASKDRPLSSLDSSIQCGNTLVTPDYWENVQADAFDDSARERVNAFDWQKAFPLAAARGGFDAVVGNPPYVKLQNFRAAYPDVATWLVEGRPNRPKPYASTRTGNFDLYLPFIEQGLRMLRAGGRLGYIAPSLWVVNEYGEGLRTLVAAGRQLDRWLDSAVFRCSRRPRPTRRCSSSGASRPARSKLPRHQKAWWLPILGHRRDGRWIGVLRTTATVGFCLRVTRGR